jgi:hypothetical protein
MAVKRPHRSVRKVEAPLQKYLRQIPQTPLISEAPQDDQRDHIGRIWQPIEGRPRPFIEPTRTLATAEPAVA